MVRFSGGLALVVVTMSLVLFIDGIDASIVQVALPEMSVGLGMGVTDGAFVVVAYIFPLAGLCIPLSRLASDGRVRPMLAVGTAVFTLASVGCATADARDPLVLFRFVQGVGAALMVSTAPAMCTTMLPPERRHMGMAYLNAASCVAIIFGPTLGGLITGLADWHWIFLINVPIGVIVIALALLLPKVSPSGPARLPEPGRALAMFVAVATGMVALELWTGGDSSPYTPVLAVICATSTAAYCLLGRRDVKERLAGIPLRGNRTYYVITAVFFVNTVIGCGVMYLLPYYLTGTAGYDTLAAGLLLSAATTVSAVVSIPTGEWCRRSGCRIPSTFSIVLRVGFCLILAVIEPSMGIALLLMQLVLMGASFGIAGTALPTRMQAHVPESMGSASAAVVIFANYIANALGVAVFALLFKLGSPGGLGSSIDVMDSSAIIDGTHFACAVGLVMTLACLYVSWRVRDPEAADPEK